MKTLIYAVLLTLTGCTYHQVYIHRDSGEWNHYVVVREFGLPGVRGIEVVYDCYSRPPPASNPICKEVIVPLTNPIRGQIKEATGTQGAKRTKPSKGKMR